MHKVSPRVLLVSNRLPVHARMSQGSVSLGFSVGGLATGLARPHAESGGLWFGWPGDAARFEPSQRRQLDESLAARRLVPVHLTATEVQRYYEGYSNGILWPLFHAMPSRMPIESRDWEVYAGVNARFAEAVAASWRPGDVVWIHDYQLLLVPALLRRLIPEARIGFFLHIPFPPSDIFRVLPRREQVLDGLLGADVVGFQTFADQRNFLAAALRLRGLEPEFDRLKVGGREVRAGVFPIGIDFDAFADPQHDSTIPRLLARSSSRESLLLAIDRLDYTKGIPNRLQAFDRMLEKYPRWRGHARLLQVSVPSREGVSAYKELRRQVDELAGRINGTWSTIGWVPIVPMHRSFDASELRALYRSVQAMLVTPLRDGMNLVAKEFVAARTDEAGVLVLSEFAGAAAELPEALLVNPHDVEGMADAFDHALRMGRREQATRMRAMRGRVREGGVERWSTTFLDALHALPERTSRMDPPPAAALLAAAEATELTLLLDYDGTLVPVVPNPEDARPDAELLELLGALASCPGVELHVVSGRDCLTLERWLGALPAHLHAEHAAVWRAPGGGWSSLPPGLGAHTAAVRAAMQAFAERTPGAFVEEKSLGLAWHYRAADIEHGAAVARELRHHLRTLLSNAPIEVLAGKKVVEVRPQGAQKGLVLSRMRLGPAVVAFGDDRTDDDLFAALPPGALAVAVGDVPERAAWRVPDVAVVRELLRRILRIRQERVAAVPSRVDVRPEAVLRQAGPP